MDIEMHNFDLMNQHVYSYRLTTLCLLGWYAKPSYDTLIL